MGNKKKFILVIIFIIIIFLLIFGIMKISDTIKSSNTLGDNSNYTEDINSDEEKEKVSDTEKVNNNDSTSEQDEENQQEIKEVSDDKPVRNDVLVRLNTGGTVSQDIYITSYNQVYGPKTETNKSTIYGDLYILEDLITIRNTEVRGTVYVDPGVDATTHLENVDAYNVVVLSGGKNSIYFENLTTDKLDIDSRSFVRVVADEGTKIIATTVKSDSIIYNVENEDGTFGVVEVLNNGEVILNGDFTDEIIVRSGVNIKTTENTQVEDLIIETNNEDSEVILSGEFENVQVKKPVKLKIEDSSTVNNVTTNAETKITIDKNSKINNLDTNKKEVSIYGLYIGNTFKLISNEEDFNFENKENISFTYLSEDEDIVIVDENGTVKGMNPGETNVTIKASNGEEEKITLVSVTVTKAPAEIAILIADNSINELPEENELKFTDMCDVEESRRLVNIALENPGVEFSDIKSYDKLEKLETKIAEMNTAITNAITAIDNLPASDDVKYTDKTTVETARTLVNTATAINGVETTDITNQEQLEALEARISEMNTAIPNAVTAIDNLPASDDVKYTDKTTVEAARTLVDTAFALNGVETGDITNLTKLEALETRIFEMNTAITNAVTAIDNLPTSDSLQNSDIDEVEQARVLVNTALAINGVVDGDISNVSKLELLEQNIGIITGYIRDALTGTPLLDTTVNFREGTDARTGTIVGTVQTNNSGFYSLGLMPGQYTGEIVGDGYVTEYFNVTSIDGVTSTQPDIISSPSLPEGDYRIVLSWGSTPSDLDSHLEGINPSFEVCWDNMSSNGVTLDIDDTDSYGPETVTITNPMPDCEYTYYVFNYDSWYVDGETLENSGATVKVYKGSSLLETFHVPMGLGCTWNVFKLKGDIITPINTMTFDEHW